MSDTPPLPPNLAALIGSVDNPPQAARTREGRSMNEAKARELWNAFVDAVEELSRSDPNAAASVMGDVSSYETDWWGNVTYE